MSWQYRKICVICEYLRALGVLELFRSYFLLVSVDDLSEIILHVIYTKKDEQGMIQKSCMQTGTLKILHEHLPQLGSRTANACFGT